MIARTDDPQIEIARCAASPLYFVLHYCQIYDSVAKGWIRFGLWQQQIDALMTFHDEQRVIVLKARQLGMSWLALSYALWQMIFQPIATVLVFSADEKSAAYLLGIERIRGMYEQLPKWMRPATEIDNATTWQLDNKSSARSFAKTGGDSYTATLAIVDEADVVPDLLGMLRRIEPTVNAGGKLLLISRPDKDKPESEFKRIYRDAREGNNAYKAVFLAWWVRPERDQAWYQQLLRDNPLDSVYEQYPATETEALAERSTNKRIPTEWLEPCYQAEKPLAAHAKLGMKDLRVYRAPISGRKYIIGMDCAEGLPTGDNSVSIVVDAATGEECAVLAGKLSPEVHAATTRQIADLYNRAPVMVENNNHGHAVILWFKEQGDEKRLLRGHDSKLGWTSNVNGKLLMYTEVAERALAQDLIIHDFTTRIQLGDIEKSTLRAAENRHDDHADAYALALVGIRYMVQIVTRPIMAQSHGLYSSRR